MTSAKPATALSRSPFIRLLDLWKGRWAERDKAALAAIQGLAPATVVTGASQGIGRALADRFAGTGYAVVLVARSQAPLEAATREIGERHGVLAIAVPCDVADETAPAVIDAALARNGLFCDILVNNAGTGLSGLFTSHPEHAVTNLVEVNVTALTRLTSHVLPGMCARGRGGVLNIASLGGAVPGPNQAAYYASKAYVISLTRALHWELTGLGVRMTAVAPGPVETAFHAKMHADQSLYRWIVPSLSAEAVAASAFRGFVLWRRVVVPGIFGKGLALALALLPAVITTSITGWLLARPEPRAKD